jgi:hypothetical protein
VSNGLLNKFGVGLSWQVDVAAGSVCLSQEHQSVIKQLCE